MLMLHYQNQTKEESKRLAIQEQASSSFSTAAAEVSEKIQTAQSAAKYRQRSRDCTKRCETCRRCGL
jgi:hypothetical protein